MEVDGLIGQHSSWLAALDAARALAPTGLPVVIAGETGTGKELVARLIHAGSRRPGPFVPIDCGSLTPGIVEAELFGHVRGAFTDARADRQGLVTSADGGTLFLDEIAELPLELQTRLLRLAQEGTIRPVGGDAERRVDVRLLAASHRDLRTEVRAGRFREDLYHRLALGRIDLPPLRRRADDIDLLVDHFLATEGARGGASPRRPTAALRAHLRRLPWPGNVRELRNACAVLAVVPRGDVVDVEDLPSHLRTPAPERGPAPAPDPALRLDLPYPQARDRWLEAFQERYVGALLARHDGNVSAAAEAAGMDRRTLQRIRARLAPTRDPDEDPDG
jgi:DNA-binding NtrC family response regulator